MARFTTSEADTRLETARLILSRPSVSDYGELRVMAAEESMFRFSERGAMTGEESWALLLRHIGQWRVANYGVFTVREERTRRFVGLVGASDFRRTLGTDFDPYPEMTWTVAPRFRDLGYAVEAGDAVLSWLSRRAGWPRSVCLIHGDNRPSLRVAEKLGFRMMRRCEYRGYEAGLFEKGGPALRSETGTGSAVSPEIVPVEAPRPA